MSKTVIVEGEIKEIRTRRLWCKDIEVSMAEAPLATSITIKKKDVYLHLSAEEVGTLMEILSRLTGKEG